MAKTVKGVHGACLLKNVATNIQRLAVNEEAEVEIVWWHNGLI